MEKIIEGNGELGGRGVGAEQTHTNSELLWSPV
jgi:hypothetical protein